MNYSILKSGILLFFFVLSFPKQIFSQEITSLAFQNSSELVHGNPVAVYDTAKTFDPFGADSLQIAEKPKLLPDNISFMENTMWGENGLMRKIGLTGPLTPETRKNELDVRRTMLTIHHISGLTTLGLMVASAFVGQKIINGRRDLGDTHKTLVSLTIANYSLTGILSVFSPPPSIRRDEFSTITVHKTLAWAHLAGMIITPILGSYIEEHHTFNTDKAHVHQISGYITTALFAASMIVITL